MYLQGDLQTIFDALYHLGVIDPVLEKDWTEALQQMPDYMGPYGDLVQTVNRTQGDVEELMKALEKFDETSLSYLAMEVAREFADFHSRENLH